MEGPTETQNNTNLPSWECENCKKKIQNGEERYHCTECSYFDICAECFSKRIHPHWMILEKYHPIILQKYIISAPTLPQLVRNMFELYAKRPMIGTRKKKEDELGAFRWSTFGDIYFRVDNFGYGLKYLLKKDREMIGLCGDILEEWIIADLSCIVHNMVSVPFYTTNSVSDLTSMVNRTQVSCIVSSNLYINKFIQVAENCKTIQLLVIIGASDEELDSLKKKNINSSFSIFSFEEVERMGIKNRNSVSQTPSNDDDIISICFTSGSTGIPKGMKFTHKAWKVSLSKIFECPDPYVTICYEPLAHASNRKNSLKTWIAGARIGLFQRPLEFLLEDSKELGVTIFDGTPLIFNRIYNEFKKEVALAQSKSPNKDLEDIEEKVMASFKPLFGNRLFGIVIGGALCAKEVISFIKKCFQCVVVEAYGTSETGGLYNDHVIKSTVEHRLEDVPEMGYFTTDKPYPRGELLVKSATMTSGYLEDEENSKSFTSDGFFRTGDIVMKTADSSYVIIDRKKLIHKLSTGEFIAPHAIENVLLESEFVSQIFVHGDPMRSFVVAVVVPNKEVLMNWAQDNGIKSNGNFEEICKNEQVVSAILSSLTVIAVKNHLRSYELPRGLLLDTEPFTVENGKLTSTLKNNRPFLIKHFQKQLEELSNSIENSRGLVASKLKEIVKKALGGEKYNENSSLIEMGADSLSTVRLASLIKENFEVDIPVDLLYSETSINEIADFIEKDEKTVSSIERRIAETPFVLEDELAMDLDVQEAAKNVKRLDKYEGKNAFLTGATGFLGVYILHYLLKRGFRVHCLVRASSKEDAIARVKKNMELHQLWKEENREFLVPVVGDLSKPLFGLSKEEFSSLCEDIDIIYHSGAKVNGVMPYAAHRLANVSGTKEIIRLAFTSKCKPIQFVSTIGVLMNDFMDEDSRLMETHLPYLGGYSQSKWVSEKLIWNLGKEFPFSIYRPGFIGSSSKTGGSNSEDYLNRLIIGLIQLKKYPSDVEKTNVVIPVDFVAKAIVSLSLDPKNFGKAFHLVNPNGHLLMKTLIEAISLSGYSLEPIPYTQWRAQLFRLAEETSKRVGKAEADKINALIPLLSYFSGKFPQGTIHPSEITQKALEEISEKPCPVYGTSILSLQIEFLRRNKLIP